MAKKTETVEWLTPAQAAEILELSEKTLANWRWLHQGPQAYRYHRVIRYKRTDIEAWLESKRKPILEPWEWEAS